MWFPKALAHPRGRFLHVLIIAAPTGVAALDDVGEAFAFAFHVGVVVHDEEITEIVEGGLLGIAHAVGVDLEVGTVGLDAEDGAFVGIIKVAAFLGGDVGALIADTPINAAVRTDREPVHVVAGIGDVDAEAVHENFADVGDAVVVGVFETPKIGRDGGVDPAIMVHHTGGDAGDGRIKTLGENGHLVGHAIAVGVAHLIDAFGGRREIFPVDGAVAVVVLERATRSADLAGREDVLEKSEFGVDAVERDVVGDPVTVFADVEVADLAAGGRGHINAALGIDRASDRIGDIEGTRPFLEHELVFAGRGLRRGERSDQGDDKTGYNKPGGGRNGWEHRATGSQK